MNQHRLVTLVTVLLVAIAAPAFAAAPLTIERYRQNVERVAPIFPTIPGRTLCVCQTVNDATATHVGYLNSFTNADAFSATINMVCQYPIFSAVDGSLTGSTHCEIFQVIK